MTFDKRFIWETYSKRGTSLWQRADVIYLQTVILKSYERILGLIRYGFVTMICVCGKILAQKHRMQNGTESIT